MKYPAPIIVLELFLEERRQLLALLGDISQEDWHNPTPCPGWSVKDVAAHILSDDLGLLSRRRDGHGYTPPYNPGIDWGDLGQLIEFINWQNDVWVQAAKRFSPRILIELLELSGQETYAYFASLDPHAVGGPVDWAGSEAAPVWLDNAREYTERWLHQQHMRDALDRPGLKERRMFHPVLDTFACALPHTYRAVEASPGTVVKLEISGEAGGEWAVIRERSGWRLVKDIPERIDGAAVLDQETAWRLFTRGISSEEAAARSSLAGDRTLAGVLLQTVSILA